MEQEKNKNGVITLLVVIIVILIVLCTLFATGTISFKSNDVTGNDGNQINENINVNNNYNAIDLSKLDDFKNIDGSYGRYNSLTFDSWNNESGYTIALSLDGNVEINDNKRGQNWKKLNINGVTDIISFYDDPSGLGYCYMLTKNNEVYYYDLSKATSGNYEVVKLDTATDVVKIINIEYCPLENAGCAWSLVGIKKDGNYVVLGNGGV